MLNMTRTVHTFPSVRLPSESGGLAVEVSLIAQLGHGAGDHMVAAVAARQRAHQNFVNELDEPSAKLGGTDLTLGDATSLYSFVVGPQGHPFHRHAGHRVFTAVSGSGGAQLRFSTASQAQLEADPQNFLRALRFINIPADCMFTVRFGGETWHQFYPLTPGSSHPVFFALSCHTNELGGNLSDELKQKVAANSADIPTLTELLPAAIARLLEPAVFEAKSVPTTTLALDAPAGTWCRTLCDVARRAAGRLRGGWAAWVSATGFLSYGGGARKVSELKASPANSLLKKHLADVPVHHDDTFRLELTGVNYQGASAGRLLASVLEGFLQNPSNGVSNLMALRNVLVKPLGLRTSPLGCPVSSLLAPKEGNVFAGRYPVFDQAVNAGYTRAEVILGANDKHLVFRSCIGVEILDEHRIAITMGTRVHCKNAFGHFYMAAIDYVHRHYVSPTMLRLAVEYAVQDGCRAPEVQSFSMGSLTPYPGV